MTSRQPWRLSYVAALFAVALLSLAGVRSNVMQAGMAMQGSMPTCGVGGMHMPGTPKSKPDPAVPGKTCSYCAVAAHAAPLSAVQPVAAPTAIAWAAWPPVASLGARGPPAFAARARGPPPHNLTA